MIMKVRIWDKDYKCFREPTAFLGNYDDLYLEDLNALLEGTEDEVIQFASEVRDAWGIMIWEGDMVEVSGFGTFTVIFRDGMFTVKEFGFSNSPICKLNHLRVVGHIYDGKIYKKPSDNPCVVQ